MLGITKQSCGYSSINEGGIIRSGQISKKVCWRVKRSCGVIKGIVGLLRRKAMEALKKEVIRSDFCFARISQGAL